MGLAWQFCNSLGPARPARRQQAINNWSSLHTSSLVQYDLCYYHICDSYYYYTIIVWCYKILGVLSLSCSQRVYPSKCNVNVSRCDEPGRVHNWFPFPLYSLSVLQSYAWHAYCLSVCTMLTYRTGYLVYHGSAWSDINIYYDAYAACTCMHQRVVWIV